MDLNTTSGSHLFFTSVLVFLYTGINIAYFMVRMDLDVVNSLYFFTVTITSVGYGEIHPIGPESRAFVSISILIGFVVNSVLAGILLNLMANSGQRRKNAAKMKEVERLLLERQESAIEQLSPSARKAFERNKNQPGRLERFFVGLLGVTMAIYQGMHSIIERIILSQTSTPDLVEEEDIRVPMTSREDYKRNRLAEDLSYTLKRKTVKMIVNLVMSIILFMGTLVLGAVVMMRLEHWEYDEALYWALITITTIGYGDYYPSSEYGKLFAVGFILFGCTVFAVTVSFVAYLPLVVKRRTRQLAVLTQFSGDISPQVLQAIVQAEFFDDFPDMRTQDGVVLKGEFVVMLLHMMKKISDADIKLCLKVFNGLDILENGMIAMDALDQNNDDLFDLEGGLGQVSASSVAASLPHVQRASKANYGVTLNNLRNNDQDRRVTAGPPPASSSGSSVGKFFNGGERGLEMTGQGVNPLFGGEKRISSATAQLLGIKPSSPIKKIQSPPTRGHQHVSPGQSFRTTMSDLTESSAPNSSHFFF